MTNPLYTNNTLVCFIFEKAKEQGINQKTLSEQAGFDPSTIGRWKTQERTPNVESVQRCLNVLGYELQVVKVEQD